VYSFRNGRRLQLLLLLFFLLFLLLSLLLLLLLLSEFHIPSPILYFLSPSNWKLNSISLWPPCFMRCIQIFLTKIAYFTSFTIGLYHLRLCIECRYCRFHLRSSWVCRIVITDCKELYEVGIGFIYITFSPDFVNICRFIQKIRGEHKHSIVLLWPYSYY
jgi:hypothetical protein